MDATPKTQARHQVHRAEDCLRLVLDIIPALVVSALPDGSVVRINQLESKIQTRLQQRKDRRQAAEREAQVKAEVLEAKAASAKAKTL